MQFHLISSTALTILLTLSVTSHSRALAANVIIDNGQVETWLSSQTVTGGLIVGNNGSGSLTIENSAVISSSGSSSLGVYSGSEGTVTINGAGSSWSIGDAVVGSGTLTVGGYGAATLTIKNGGEVNVFSSVDIASNADSIGTITVSGDGSYMGIGGNFIVGGRWNSGTGYLTIEDGAKVFSKLVSTIGFGAGSTGAVLVTGPGSSWEIGDELWVSDEGNATLMIANGGRVSNTTNAGIGYAQGVTATVTVTGSGSTWTNTGDHWVGYQGLGSMSIEDGGSVSNINAYVGTYATGKGTVVVTGTGSSWVNAADVVIGYAGNGTLTIANGAAVDVGGIMRIAYGTGASGTLNIGAIAGGTALAPGTLNVGSIVFGAGTGLIVFNHTDNNSASYHFTAAVSGAGRVETYAGVTTLTATNTYTGTTMIFGGMLRAGVAGAFSAGSDFIVGNSGSLDANGLSQTIASLSNSGTVVIGSNGSAGAVGATLTVTGNYTGNDGILMLRTMLGDSSSVSDILAINNGTVSGKTQVMVTNAGGLGASTMGDGILIVETNSATIASSAGFWAPTNSIQAGLYAYNVVRGTNSPDNWYLTSAYIPPVDPLPVEPPVVTGPSLPNFRDAVPVYMSAPALASKLGLAMLGTYHDRVGEDYSDVLLLPEQPKEEWCGSGKKKYRCPVAAGTYEKTLLAGWARLFGETGSVGYGGKGSAFGRLDKFYRNGPSYDYDLAGFQAGMDLYRKQHASGIRDIAGVYVGYANIDADVQAVYGGKAGTMSMDGYSFGAYWTRKGPSGWYIDAVAQGTIYDDVKGTTFDGFQMKTNGWAFTASLESGYPFALGNGWMIEPQAQLIYQHISLDDSADRAGLVVYGDADVFYGRVGGRLTKDWTLSNGHRLTTWVRTNLWHTFGDDGRISFPTVAGGNGALKTRLGGTWGQVGLGASGQISQNMRLFATADYNMSLDAGRGHSLSGRIGAKYVW